MAFVKSTTHQQKSLFTHDESQLSEKGKKRLKDDDAWFNVFHKTVALNINEENFRPLYKEGNMGAPTKNIYRLVSMIIIKEGLGISDEELENRITFDIAVRRAMGIVNMDDEAPSIDTYYLFKRRLFDYKVAKGVDLMNTCYKDATKVQLKELNISGKVVRMDSKLIGSNIAYFSRYQIVHETLKKELSEATINSLPKKLREKVADTLKEEAQKTVYKSDKQTLSKKFSDLGQLVYAVLVALKKTDGLLHRVFYEQFKLERESDEKGNAKGPKVAVPIPDKEIKSTSVQNPNDPDAEYRKKNKTEIRGYVANAVETLEEGKPSIIVGVQLEGSTTSDQKLAKPALEEAKEVTGQTPEESLQDGGYASKANRDYAKENNIGFITTGLQGKEGRFELHFDEKGNLKVFDKVEGREVDAIKVKCKDKEKWRIKVLDKNGKLTYRYFDEGSIERAIERQRWEKISQESKNRRNNVESAMFCIGCNLRNHKTRYRGLERNRMFLYARCMWINFRRIRNYKISSNNMPK